MAYYTEKDFKIISGDATQDKRIAYIFRSKDKDIEANFFWMPNNVQIRYLSWGNNFEQGMIAYPFANSDGVGIIPSKEQALSNFVRHLERRGITKPVNKEVIVKSYQRRK